MHLPSIRAAARLGALVLCATVSITASLVAQNLRTGLVRSDAVVVGRSLGVQPLGSERFVHTVEVLEVLAGDDSVAAGGRFSISVPRRVSDQPKPAGPAQVRLFCLVHDNRDADLPAQRAPWFRMTGYPGDHPALAATWNDDPQVRFSRTVLASEAGLAPAETAQQVMSFVFDEHPTVRLEAVRLLTERDIVRGELSELQKSGLAARAIGESDDVDYKIALASLAAEFRLENLVRDLCLSLDQVEDLRFSRALGRIARYMHGDAATDMLLEQRERARGEAVRQRLLVAVGATGTAEALETLLRIQTAPERSTQWVEAALEAHGAPAALEAARKGAKAREAKRESGGG